jgi:hypothetical protein
MYRTCCVVLLCLAIVSILAVDVCALDGERKGFILGFSVGPAVTSFTQKVALSVGDITESERENKFGAGTDFRIGYAPSNQLMLYYTNKLTWLRLTNTLNEDVTVVNGVGLFGLSYYLLPQAPSFYVAGTIGTSLWGVYDDLGNAWTGFGLGGTAGYEFTKYWSVEGTVMWGKPGDSAFGVDVSTNAIGVMIALAGTWY